MPTDTMGRELPRANATIYLTSAQVCARYGGMSDMSLSRWLNDDELGFPKPIRINGRRFWKEADLAAWDDDQAAKKDGEGRDETLPSAEVGLRVIADRGRRPRNARGQWND
jgi:predicted DNA-binding transcriptional regulator AlpA